MKKNLYQPKRKEPEEGHKALLSFEDEGARERYNREMGQTRHLREEGPPPTGRLVEEEETGTVVDAAAVMVVKLPRSFFWTVFSAVFNALVAFTVLLALTCMPELDSTGILKQLRGPDEVESDQR